MTYCHLNARERINIFYLHQMHLPLREIGRRLNRSHTTISREISRNKRRIGGYCDRAAQTYADNRKAIPRHHTRYSNLLLRAYVFAKLRLGWSPEIISHRLQRDCLRCPQMHVTHETIYQWIYRDAEAGGNLYTQLIRSHNKRRKQRRYGSLRGLIPNRVDISARPRIVETRGRYGDWEGDTMVGYRHQGRLVTHVERKSRYLLAAKAANGTASVFNQVSLALYQDIPIKYRKTLTLDNGSENSAFRQLEDKLSFAVYFAAPYASWQRGCNENTNGLLRRFFPKGTNFLNISNAQLEKVVNLLNHRPRKCLNYRTPFEVFSKMMGGALGN